MKAHEHLSRPSQQDLATLLGEVVSETPLLISYLILAINAHEEQSYVAEAKNLSGFITEIVREIRDSQHLETSMSLKILPLASRTGYTNLN